MAPFARTIYAKKKYVVSSALGGVDWNAELVRGDLGKAVVTVHGSDEQCHIARDDWPRDRENARTQQSPR